MSAAPTCERCGATDNVEHSHELGQALCADCFGAHADQLDAADDRPAKRGRSQAAKLVELADGVEFFHDPHGTAYATFTVADHRETEAIRRRGFRSYLERAFFEREGKPPSAQAVQDALGVMDGKARFDGAEHGVHVRLAGDDDALYLDLAGPSWDAVAVTRNGWQVVSSPPVKFRRPKGLGALPRPAAVGDLDRLRRLINVRAEDYPLVVGWMIGALRYAGPFPVLASYGEQGTAKSTTQRIVRGTFDPSSAPLRAAPRNEHELVIAARNSWVLGFDNTSSVSAWLSDALSRIATGAGYAARELYSDADEVIFEEKRPVLINGIEEVVTRPDLLDRALIAEHPRISDAKRRPEREVWREFEAAQPAVLAGLLDALVGALRNLDAVELAELPRMADFCEWVVAAEPALSWPAGTFLDTYTRNRGSAHEVALDSSPIAPFVRELVGWEGTATELLDELDAKAADAIKRTKSWPRSAKALAGALRRLAPNLRAVGIEVVFKRDLSRRTVAIRTAPNLASFASFASSTHESHDAHDANDAEIRTQSAAPKLAGDNGHHTDAEIERLIAAAEDADREAATLGLSAHDQEPGRG